MVSWHIVGIHSGYAQFLGLLIAIGITPRRKSRWHGYQTYSFVRLAGAQAYVEHSSLETWDYLHPVYLNVCVANSSEGNCTNLCHILLSLPSSVRRKNWVSTASTKPQELSQDTSSQFHKQSRRYKGPAHLHRVPLPHTALQSHFPKYRLFSHISVRESSSAWMSFLGIMHHEGQDITGGV